MPDREKVLKGLEACRKTDCINCPYFALEKKVCLINYLLTDAIEMLKEQEAVEPYITGSGESFETAETWWYECGNCNKPIDPNDKFCRHCGQAVKWE